MRTRGYLQQYIAVCPSSVFIVWTYNRLQAWISKITHQYILFCVPYPLPEYLHLAPEVDNELAFVFAGYSAASKLPIRLTLASVQRGPSWRTDVQKVRRAAKFRMAVVCDRVIDNFAYDKEMGHRHGLTQYECGDTSLLRTTLAVRCQTLVIFTPRYCHGRRAGTGLGVKPGVLCG